VTALHTPELVLIGIALLAATVNGGVGYGFSSVTVPVALLFYSSRVLNPALVLAEVGINLVVFAANRRAFGRVWRQTAPMLVGAVPGVVIGGLLLSSASHTSLKLGTYLILLPLIVAQTAGWRRPIRRSGASGVALGAGIGTLYSATTLSGPPLALLFNNQGLAKEEFRAAVSLFRIVESTFAAATYLALGLHSSQSVQLSGIMLPSIVVGLFIGHLLLRPLQSETFRRVCMGIDALLVSFGLSQTALGMHLLPGTIVYPVLALVMAFELWLLLRHLRGQPPTVAPAAPRWTPDYPVALKLAGRPVLLVGAGRVAEARLEALLEARARVHAVAPVATELFHRRKAEGRLKLSLRPYRSGDCRGVQLVFIAIGVERVSRAVAAEARARGLLVNAADLPGLCDFHIPSVGRRGPVTVAVSTAGLAPSVAQAARRRAMEVVGSEYGVLARLLGLLRLRLPGGPARTRLFGALVASDVSTLLARGHQRLAWQRIREILRESA
jgi:uncharacterized protein